MSEINTAQAGAEATRAPSGQAQTASGQAQTASAPKPPLCPRCRRASGLPLARPATGGFNRVYRCNTRSQGCGFLWSPKTNAA